MLHRSHRLPCQRHGTTSHIASASIRMLTVSESLFCGAVARAAQILSMYPVDTVKTRVQFSRNTTQTAGQRLGAALSQGTLYRGALSSLVGQIPYGMLTFGALETTRSWLREQYPDAPNWTTTVAAAAVGDALGSLWLTPSEVIKQKTQAGVHSGAAAAVSAVARSRGAAGFYQGYGSALARDVPFRMLQFAFFEALNEWRAKIRNRPATPIENLLVGALAGTAAAATTTPFDVVRTRMMAQTPGAGAFTSAFDCVVKTVAKEGPQALFRGLMPRCLLIGPSSAVFFLAYEAAKKFCFNRQPKVIPVAVSNGTTKCARRRLA